MQTNARLVARADGDTVISVDYVNSLGRDLNIRPRVNQRIPGSRRSARVSALLPTPLNPNTNANRPAVSRGKSEYNALILGVRRRLSNGVDFTASLHAAEGAEHHRQRGRRAEHREHPGPEQPVRRSACSSGRTPTTDARHCINLSARRSSCRGASASRRSSSIRSALPVTWSTAATSTSTATPPTSRRRRIAVDAFDADTGVDRRSRRSAPARRSTAAAAARSRRLNLRVSKVVPPRRPRARRGDRRGLQPVQRHQPERLPRPRVDRAGAPAPPDPTLLQPTTLLRRLPSSGTARRPARVPVHVLSVSRSTAASRQERREGGNPLAFFVVPRGRQRCPDAG